MPFSELDAQGKQLTPDGRREIAALFVAPAAPRLSKITVVKDFVVSETALQGNRAELYVEYTEYGHIDLSRVRFSDFLTIEARSEFRVLATPAGWRIEGTPPNPI